MLELEPFEVVHRENNDAILVSNLFLAIHEVIWDALLMEHRLKLFHSGPFSATNRNLIGKDVSLLEKCGD